MDRPTEEGPPKVGAPLTQGGETGRWAWVERAVWTDRMLEALDMGVKGGKWFSLIDKVHAHRNLKSAWGKVRANRGAAGVDGESIRKFARHEDRNLEQLHERLSKDRYQPRAVRRVYIPKPGTDKQRPLGIPTVKDRVVQMALRNVLEPIFEREFHDSSFGFRPGRGCRDALRRVDDLLHNGFTWVVDADIQSYFDSIDHDLLMERVERRVADGRVLALLRQYLSQRVLEDHVKEWVPTQGTPQGAVISPLLANIYLHDVDVACAQADFEMVRYADDLVIVCRTEAAARRALDFLQGQMSQLKLTLHPEKTRLVDATQSGGFEFLGYHFERGRHWPRSKSIKALKDRLRPLTQRNNGHSLNAIIQTMNPILRGWFGYFKHSTRRTFPAIDGWVRGRLRAILRKRTKRRGRARGTDNVLWPNSFFEAQGLFTMARARHALLQSRAG